MPDVLVVDSDRDARLTIVEILERRGTSASTTASVKAAARELKQQAFSCLITGDRFSDGTIFDLIMAANTRRLGRLIIITEDQGLLQWGKAACNGRVRIIAKPVDPEVLRMQLLDVVWDRSGTKIPPSRKKSQAKRFGIMLGNSQVMQEIYNLIAKVAPTDATVLICGESGTGKELVAKSIHERSSRKDKPFIAINCGAIPENLVESELFGHEKGAFTGADKRRRGVFERADSGTLFLDEITEMSEDMQVRLLRVLETGKIQRVGGDEEIDVDVRVVAATNRDAQEAVEEGLFREDLMYRLAVFPISLPPLRERGNDIILLANHFLSEHNKGQDVNKRLTPDGEKRLLAYHWPGNVRQLRNIMQRAFILEPAEMEMQTLVSYAREDEAAHTADGIEQPGREMASVATGHMAISAEELSVAREIENEAGGRVSVPLGVSIADAEEKLIRSTLEYYSGDKKKAAKVLGISLKTLYNRLKEYEEDGEE